MRAAIAAARDHVAETVGAWDRFWFTPVDPAPLCAIRVLTGLLLLWTHLVWSFDLSAFFGSEGWLPPDLYGPLHERRIAWSYFDMLNAAWLRWLVHVVNLVFFLLLTVGLFSRVAAFWSFFAALNYALHVSPGAFFGLDKINCLLAMYVMLGPCGARYSLDRLRRERGGDPSPPAPSWTANLALRLIQTHLCVVYLFSGLGKLQGVRWWDGTATWFSVANVEYRSLDMTWLSDWLWLVDLLTHATVFLELFYCCLIWSGLARPWVLLAAISMHGFIGLAMGMPEFAAAMITANFAFVSAGVVRAVLDPIARRLGAALGGGAE